MVFSFKEMVLNENSFKTISYLNFPNLNKFALEKYLKYLKELTQEKNKIFFQYIDLKIYSLKDIKNLNLKRFKSFENKKNSYSKILNTPEFKQYNFLIIPFLKKINFKEQNLNLSSLNEFIQNTYLNNNNLNSLNGYLNRESETFFINYLLSKNNLYKSVLNQTLKYHYFKNKCDITKDNIKNISKDIKKLSFYNQTKRAYFKPKINQRDFIYFNQNILTNNLKIIFQNYFKVLQSHKSNLIKFRDYKKSIETSKQKFKAHFLSDFFKV
jgi:hypothetical protein